MNEDVTDPNAPAQATRQRRLSPLAITIVLVVILILGFLAVAAVLTEVLWYRQTGFLPVLTTQWLAAGAMFLIGFVGIAVPVFFAIDIAYRKRPVYARLTAQLDRYQELFEPLRRLVKWGLPAVVGLFGGFSTAAQWQSVLLWINGERTGETDAQFGLDISFFLFDLPMLQGIVTFASAATLLALIAGVATSYLYGGIAFSGRDVRVSKATRIQAAVLATLYLVLQAASLWLDQYRTLTGTAGIRTGAMFSDVNAVIPGKQILAGIAIIVAVLFIVTAFTGKWRLPVIGTALLIASSLVLGVGYPWAIQQFQVGPDEKSLESEYIERNIAATRAAYGIEDVEKERYDAVTDAEPGALRNDATTTANIRIIDPEIVSPTFAQLEQIRQYYQFPSSLNVDRYEIDGQVEDTVSAVRDINIEEQTGWYNRTLVYTHGYGLVAAFGNQRSPGGEPVFLENGIPTSGKLGTFEPRIYFGMDSPEYSIVGGDRSKAIELDFPADAESTAEASAENADDAQPAEPGAESPAGDEETTEQAVEGEEAGEDGGRQNMTTFSGDGGPVLDNIFTKLIYALKFQDMEVLLSGAVVDGSQILYDRNPVDRVQKVAPYLTIDKAPYASVVDGRVVWIVDGYTTSDDYPYSEASDMNALTVDADASERDPLGKPINYIRNSVKATVDAYDGSVSLYAWDTEDPLLKSWSKIFPDTLKDVSEMSGDLLSHVRYPSDLFKVQRAMLGEYHVTDADAFYSAEDKWRTPDDPVSTATAGAAKLAQPPYYLTLAAGADADPNYSIYSTYIPDQSGEGSRDILTGYLAANSNAGSEDGTVSEDYGKLKLLTLPKGDPIPGPGQVQNSFTTDSNVSNLLNILRQGESQVISGNLLTLPVGGGLLYVQPVYVQAKSGTSFPILQKVLVAFGDQIAFEDTLDEALDALFGGNSGADAGDTGTTPTTEDPETGDAEAGDSGDGGSGGGATGTLRETLTEMQDALKARDTAMQEGDWAAYGEADERLKQAIEAALEAQ
ncbi:UPF0182 family protein [Leucobacter chromiiresistens]|uniref:UPF0182 protein SAMN04488565_2484 n=1 Tax=Leucobacter chromiiresistens TaxID=1079994 RepID=A0A1H1ACK0_9MICO|nr:UPF0182 family protein [Leucobacter chromiiresistens]SDQ36966.1 hypothetical protein SAMN04488565_2484 [Leucobacter chromiiresistens]